ncbi:hypothetical protein Q31b_58950 [Novipirellula aureliae]|uniref:Uncharacterized protein n=1 Tax=Novipirellula aureliae TaxID=2527966 RepID=A0A5C6D5R8_9BACT|nr:hypothetical protein Q31b_58940 [Novipirellula aureliae]TWU31027.1 hypothetical protein Q31b_58950 [Novipirellula aureliae]
MAELSCHVSTASGPLMDVKTKFVGAVGRVLAELTLE